MEDEAVEGCARIYPDDKVSAPVADGFGDAPAVRIAAERAVRRRESALLAALAITGAIVEYPLAFALKSLDRSELVRALPFLGVTIVLAALIPLSLRLSGELGLPGAPLVAAKLAGEKLYFSIRSLLRVSIGYAFLAAIAGGSVLAMVIVPLMLIQHGGPGLTLPNTPMLTLAPGRIAFVGASVAIAAAVSEEIQFRLVLFAIFGRIARLMSRDSRGHPGRRALWMVTLAQGYLFGLIHLAPLAGTLFHSSWRLLLGGLVMPQTWEGVVFGRLYLRRGLEASIIAHASMDVALFVMAAIGVLHLVR
ncbi:MAG TPA: CPBP family glutamic-type intramembrane protease [Candidatus Binatus sp.]|uniref:CPBP family glutamic-type intramembrane protease n=1 Tax=Candidatus Binatus sp. TaxID=2811406 RepID=UPI002F3E81BB